MSRRRRGPFAALALLVTLLAAGAEAQDPDCPRWRDAFTGMPFKMVTIEAGAKTLAVRVKAADNSERQAGAFSARPMKRSSATSSCSTSATRSSPSST